MNQVSEKVAVLGEEAFMEPVKSTETTIGAFGGFDVSGFDIDVGIRWDDIERKGTIREMHEEDEDHMKKRDMRKRGMMKKSIMTNTRVLN